LIIHTNILKRKHIRFNTWRSRTGGKDLAESIVDEESNHSDAG
jgi:hypothetical protein